jgi:hypothetical protein
MVWSVISYHIEGMFGRDPDSHRSISDPYSIYESFSFKIESLGKNHWNSLAIDLDALLKMN